MIKFLFYSFLLWKVKKIHFRKDRFNHSMNDYCEDNLVLNRIAKMDQLVCYRTFKILNTIQEKP